MPSLNPSSEGQTERCTLLPEAQFQRSDTGMCIGEWLTAPSPLWCFHTYLSILAVTLSVCILLLSLIQNEVTSSLGPLWNRLWATKWGREQEAGKQGREGWERASLTRALSYLPSVLRCKHWGFSCALWPLLLWHRPGMDILKGSSWSVSQHWTPGDSFWARTGSVRPQFLACGKFARTCPAPPALSSGWVSDMGHDFLLTLLRLLLEKPN